MEPTGQQTANERVSDKLSKYLKKSKPVEGEKGGEKAAPAQATKNSVSSKL